ncbi:MAG TPA: DNA mismatch repair endonuclease MutL [Thermoanaerobaculia bacterium]
MARIRRLSGAVIDRIAAGEVVERPASVVKELVENALDAGASRVEVDVEGGGIRKILVRDDGTGMAREDARLAVERHATSKIASDADLASVATYGFRGEALPSIGSVSRLTLTTADGGTGQAARVRVEYGAAPRLETAARPRGTDVLVEELFAKTPGRRKFLSSPDAEGRHAAAAVTRAALANPSVAFFLRSNGRDILEAPAAVDRAARILQVFGRDLLGELEPLEARAGDLHLQGYVTRGSVTFANRRHQHLFVNGRPVEDRALSRAIGQAAREAIRTDRHPAVFLFLQAAPGAVDVNVSPAKTQVRFADGGTAYRLLYHGVVSALLSGKEERRLRVVSMAGPIGGASAVGEPPSDYPHDAAESPRGSDGPATPPRPRVEPPPAAAPAPAVRPPELSAIGQHRESYIVASGPEGLLIVDQHAAHERVLYERIRDRIASGRVLSQRLLMRVPFEATPEEAETLAARETELSAAGFELEPMSGKTWALAALPAEATGREPKELLSDALARLAEAGSEATPEQRRDKIAASLACRSAVTIRWHLTPEEIRRLLADWQKAGDRFTCPHGRPVVLALSEEELERYFKRR